ncbi:MAG: hypothetical protein HYX89_08070 [Chloroflexi bacterium]|nr:hypothetical protein [Chloroflexota bacterium]
MDLISTMTIQDGQHSIRTTQTILQNIPILGVGPGGGLSKVATGGNPVATLLVTHQDAVALNFVMDAGGTFHLLLRAPLDTGDAKTQPVTPDYLTKTLRLLP